MDQDEEYKWSDNTKTDFENMSKNCTGREHEPDCQPEEKAQQWYDWNGADKGTWVCKKPAKYGHGLMRSSSKILLTRCPILALSILASTCGRPNRNTTTLEELAVLNWEDFKKPYNETVTPIMVLRFCLNCEDMEKKKMAATMEPEDQEILPKPKRKGLDLPTKKPKSPEVCVDC